MLKNFFLGLSAFACLTLTSCDKLKDAVPDVVITPSLSTGNIPVNAMRAAETYIKDTTITAASITDAIKNAGKSTSNVKTITVTAFELTIPAAAAWSFADVESGEVLINGVSVGALPAGTTGKVATFAPPATPLDIKAAILSASGFSVKYTLKAKNATTATVLTGVLKTKVSLGI